MITQCILTIILLNDAAIEQSAIVNSFPATKSCPSKNTSRNPIASSKDVFFSSGTSISPKNSIGNFKQGYVLILFKYITKINLHKSPLFLDIMYHNQSAISDQQ